MGNYKEKLAKITTFIFDYDGVMGDGKVWFLSENQQLRNSNVKDGYAVHEALKRGYRIAVISGGKGDCIRERLNYIGVQDVFLQVRYKLDKFNEYIQEHQLNPEEVLYMGDDIPDYEVLQAAGVSACPADAVKEIQEVSQYISHLKGGDGCVRDVIEQVMRARGDWFVEGALHW